MKQPQPNPAPRAGITADQARAISALARTHKDEGAELTEKQFREMTSLQHQIGLTGYTVAELPLSALTINEPNIAPNWITGPAQGFQSDVATWLGQCFPSSLSSNMTERGDRLLEEVLELLQSHGYDSARVPTLVNYVFGRPVGEPAQEVGGVMVTLAAYCSVAGLNMQADGQAELDRINQPEVMARIRAKQEAKNALQFDTPLPGNAAQPSPAGQGDALHDAVGRIFGCDGSPWRTRDVAAVLRNYAAIAARQPVGQEPVAWFVYWSDMPKASPELARSASRIAEVSALSEPPRIVPLYIAPPAQAVDHRAALLAEERAHGETIDQRDRYHEVADDLAAHIAAITGVDIGEHSSANCPWQNAIAAAEKYQPAPPAQTVDLEQFRALAAKFDGLGDEEVGDAYSGPYYECARQLRTLIDSQAVRNG